MGMALASMKYVGHFPGQSDPEAALGALTLGVIVAAPGLLALLARQGRPALVVPAGAALVPLSFSSFSGVTLPLLIPAVMLIAGYGHGSAGGSRPRAAAGAVALAFLMLIVAAFMLLFTHDDPASYSTPTRRGSTSDVIVAWESLRSLALAALAVGSAWWLSAPISGSTNHQS